MKQVARTGCLIILGLVFLVAASTMVLLLSGQASSRSVSATVTLVTEVQPVQVIDQVSRPPPRAVSRDIRQAFAKRRERIRVPQYLTDSLLIQDALDQARTETPRNATPKVAFLFLVREEIFFEPLWRYFFEGDRGDRHSIYVHATPGYTFSKTSFFSGKQIPSRKVERLSPTLVNAIRRLFATAILDREHHNEWFVNLCERAIPLRSFPETYAYLMGSDHSFIQSFNPVQRYHDNFHPEPIFRQAELRKGELWMAIKRKHAVMVLEDYEIYAKFKMDCWWMCSIDEQYFQTLLHLRDPGGIANRTVMYVDWNFEHTSSPMAFGKGNLNVRMLSEIRDLTEDAVGSQHDTGTDNDTVICEYNGGPGAKCFLFARKFWPDALDPVLKWFEGVTGPPLS